MHRFLNRLKAKDIFLLIIPPSKKRKLRDAVFHCGCLEELSSNAELAQNHVLLT